MRFAQFNITILLMTCAVVSFGFSSDSAFARKQHANTAKGGAASTQPRRARLASKSGGNPDIPKIVAEISSRNIEATIRKLVSFGTRNTLSEQNNPNRGIG